MAILSRFRLGEGALGGVILGGLHTIGRALKPRLFTRSYRSVAVEAKTQFAVSTETKTHLDASAETREVAL